MSFVYIASPYTVVLSKSERDHLDDIITGGANQYCTRLQEDRFEAVSAFTANLVKAGTIAYSPIAHSHPLAVKYGLRGDFDFWMHQNYGMLSKASRMIVLCLDGWRESKGVQAEIAFAEQCGIEVTYSDGGE